MPPAPVGAMISDGPILEWGASDSRRRILLWMV